MSRLIALRGRGRAGRMRLRMAQRRAPTGAARTIRTSRTDSGKPSPRIGSSVMQNRRPHGRSGPVHRQDHNKYFPAVRGQCWLTRGRGKGGVPLRTALDGDQRDEDHFRRVKDLVVRDIVTGALEEAHVGRYSAGRSGQTVWYFGEGHQGVHEGRRSSTAGVGGGGRRRDDRHHHEGQPGSGDKSTDRYRPRVAEDVA